MKTKPKSKVPFCWYCSRKLNAGGHQYITIIGDDDHKHSVHASCHQREQDQQEQEGIDILLARGVSLEPPVDAIGSVMGNPLEPWIIDD